MSGVKRVRKNLVQIALAKGAKMPKRGSKHAAGYDLYALEDVNFPRGGSISVRTGVRFRFNEMDYYAKISSRSGLAFKEGVYAFHGTVDPDYEGEVFVKLYSIQKPVTLHDGTPSMHTIEAGRAIAQIVFTRFETPDLEEINDIPAGGSERGEKGFGSTDSR